MNDPFFVEENFVFLILKRISFERRKLRCMRINLKLMRLFPDIKFPLGSVVSGVNVAYWFIYRRQFGFLTFKSEIML